LRHSLGINLADFGFGFLEKLHEPIFLVHRLGKIVRMNEAGRKLLRIVRQNSGEVESFINDRLLVLFKNAEAEKNYERIPIGNKGHQVVARNLQGSDYILVEVIK
jgi:hypothetical protein